MLLLRHAALNTPNTFDANARPCYSVCAKLVPSFSVWFGHLYTNMRLQVLLFYVLPMYVINTGTYHKNQIFVGSSNIGYKVLRKKSLFNH